jgi:hypothetical protein
MGHVVISIGICAAVFAVLPVGGECQDKQDWKTRSYILITQVEFETAK